MILFYENIQLIGMLCLGAFVGGIMNYGLAKIHDHESFLKVSAAIAGSVFSGGVFLYLQFMTSKLEMKGVLKQEAIYFYPIGLILALLWLQVLSTIENLLKPESKNKIIGWLHFIFVSLITIGILIILFFYKYTAPSA